MKNDDAIVIRGIARLLARGYVRHAQKQKRLESIGNTEASCHPRLTEQRNRTEVNA